MIAEEEKTFQHKVRRATGQEALYGCALERIQVNVGLQCNLACRHCHVEASPQRQEQMTWSTMEQVVILVEKSGCRFVDLTGGAPERNPNLRRLIFVLRERQVAVQVRTNLSVLLEEGMADLPAFFCAHQVSLVASLPCYLEKNVDTQRGTGVFKQTVQALRILNALGYGSRPDRVLNLVYNPAGATLPPSQSRLEDEYRRILQQRFGVTFSHLLTLVNMPIGRFQADLRRHHREADYWQLLHQAFNPATLDGLMCRHQISVGWDGRLYDCDFNLALRKPIASHDLTGIMQGNIEAVARRRIITSDHCLGCTAGDGSSCGGALVD